VKIMLTGAGGFVGAHVLRHLLMNTDYEIVCPVSFRHRGLPERIESSICTDPEWVSRVKIVHWDMSAPASRITLRELEGCAAILNVASESHVDRSMKDPVGFTENNVSLMLNVLEVARTIRPSIVLQMSTDEVYGPAYGDHRHKEWETVAPSNPYSASKAAQEAICFAYWRTYGVPVVITNTMNIIGEMQDPEKFVPMIIRNVLRDEPVTVHVSPDGTAGSRFYLHARNLADAWAWLVKEHTSALSWPVPTYAAGASRPDRYNIVGEREVYNDELVHMIAGFLDREPKIERVNFHESRPGHDLRYALDGGKLARLGWRAPVSLEESLRKTVEWTLAHPEWLAL
jgi:dTDP-glucose 4,6-dehydratase